MRFIPLVIVLATVSASAGALAQSPQSFTLQKGQAVRIAPDGKVDVFATMQGNSAHVAEMEKRAHPIAKGMGIWVGEDGKLRYLIDPVEGVESFGHQHKN
jgi:hypothetical protein